MNVRLRYAPSPTGDPHLGILRTALFDYLYAKQQGGTFILRLEDTDQKRERDGSDLAILHSLKWLGIEADEGLYLDGNGQVAQRGGYGPYIQSERLPVYREHVQALLESGAAYRCFCTPDRLAEMRAEQERNHQPPRYDRRCRAIGKQESERRSEQETYVIRQAMPDGQEVVADDLVRGEIRFQSDDLDDQVLLKSDGFPTYQLANVVDDHLMQISHVFRGEEWIPSLPKNLLLYEAFGWQPPKFAHMPVILGPDGKRKLSKREGADPVLSYRDRGYLPEAVVNFLAFLGWSPGTEEEFFTLPELVQRFDVSRVQRAAAIFNPDRLEYMDGWYIRQLDAEEVADRMLPYLVAEGLLRDAPQLALVEPIEFPQPSLREYLLDVASAVQERLKHFDESAAASWFFFRRPPAGEALRQLVVPKKSDWDQTSTLLERAILELEALTDDVWTVEAVQQKLFAYIEGQGLKNAQVLWPIRAALTGSPASPGAFEMLVLLGRTESLRRLQNVLQ